jgi:hypothetical protein
MNLLPINIDYNKYTNNSGMRTKTWGSAGWDFLFSSIMCYPIKILKQNKQHDIIKKSFIDLFKSLQYTLPCIFCRESYIDFYKKINIEKFLSGRIELMYWLYLIKDQVNKKLIIQELICIKAEKNRLKKLYINNKISFDLYRKNYTTFKNETLITVESPEFKHVLDYYENNRAKLCSTVSLKCQ